MKMGVLSSFLAITIGLLAAAFITGINTNEKISVESNSFEEISLLYEAGEFEDNAYFEPFYLKDFVAGKPKKLL